MVAGTTAGDAPSRPALFYYGQMAFPLSFAGLPVYLHAPDFYAAGYGVPLASLGAVLLVLRIFDAIQDPMIGYVSDRFHKQRKAILSAGLLCLATGFWMIFHPSGTATLAWFFAAVLICTTGYSIVAINYQALGGLWHASGNDRTRITGWREALGLLGLLVAAILPSLLGNTTNPDRAFHGLSIIFLLLLLISAWMLFRWLEDARLDSPGAVTAGLAWRTLFASSWRRRFYALYFVNALASSVPAVLVIFFIRDRLGAEEQTGLFLLLYFLSGAMAMPLWQRLSASMGKFRCWMVAMIVAVITFGGAAFLGQGDITGFALVCILSGIALGADLALPPSILADHIETRNAQASATSLFAILAFLAKAALALATGLALPALGFAGYQPGEMAGGTVAFALTAAYAVLPLAIKLAAVLLLWLNLAVLEQAETAETPPAATAAVS